MLMQCKAKCGVHIDGRLALLKKPGYYSGNNSDLCSNPVWDNSCPAICHVLSQPFREDGAILPET
jgi:hypothetical protein